MLTDRLFDLDWIRRTDARRVILVTDDGRRGLHATCGLRLDWEDEPTAAVVP